jgi:MFS family permease
VTSDEDSWAQAQSILDGTASEETKQRLRRAQRRNLLVVAGVVVVVLGAVAALVLSGDGGSSDSHDVPVWRTLTGLLVMLVGIVVAFPAVRRQVRRSSWREGWRTPLPLLRMSQRRHLTREVLGRAPADPAHVPLGRHLATLFVRQSLEPRLALGVVVLIAGQLVLSASWFWAVVLALMVAGWPVTVRRNRRAQAFLDAHPAQRIA